MDQLDMELVPAAMRIRGYLGKGVCLLDSDQPTAFKWIHLDIWALKVEAIGMGGSTW